MKKKQRFTPFFRRTLCVILSFWFILMLVLTVMHYDKIKTSVEEHQQSNAQSVRVNSQLTIEGNATWERKPAILSNWMSGHSYYSHHSLAVYRLYDENGKELARAQLTRGSITPMGTGTYSVFLHFDPFFSKEDHIEFAKRLVRARRDGLNLTSFYGHSSPAYGEVTGIMVENVMLPQKLVYYYEDQTVTLMESHNPMFDGVELTTMQFDHANVDSALADDEMPPEKIWDLYWKADALLDKLVAQHTPSTQGGYTLLGNNAKARVGNYYDLPGYPLAYSYVYTPLTIMTDGLELIYVLTFLDALLIAWYISHTQRTFQERERELTRAMAHEFKTPAAVIRAYAEALEAGVAPQRRSEYLHTLMDEADRMGSMVNELLELSRLTGSSHPLDKKEVDLRELTQRCFERLRLPMEERGLHLELNLEPCTCVGDEKRLERAVSNLALNVLYHSDPGTVKVRLMAHRVLTVENPCPPIPEDVLRRLWEPFYKGEQSRSGEGSGLGLAIVENIVHLHGGECIADNTENGVRFRISIPGF